MSAIYERQKTAFAGSFPSDLATFTLAGDTVALGIIQQVQLQFSQQVARIYDVSNGGASFAGKVPVYYVGGRTQGQGSIGRVLGPNSGQLCEFYQKMGNICNPQDLTFNFQGGCDAGSVSVGNGVSAAPSASVSYTIESALMQNLSIGTDSNSMIVNENVGLMFANMSCDQTNS